MTLFRIATWNVNSIRVRLPSVLRWLAESAPDVLLLQELKAADEHVPVADLQAAGYTCAVLGQKAYNGVAILSRHPIQITARGLPVPSEDRQARYLEADIQGLRIASLYLPNGNPAPGDKYAYKLDWMDRLITHAQSLLRLDQPVILGGDFNVCPTDLDVYNPAGWKLDALCRTETRHRFRTLENMGYWDAFRARCPDPGHYTFWDYQSGGWQRDQGLRIDHVMVSAPALDRMESCTIDRAVRGWDQPSDHAPVTVTLEIP